MSLDDDLRTLLTYQAKVALEADYVTRLMFWAHENEDYLDYITNKYYYFFNSAKSKDVSEPKIYDYWVEHNKTDKRLIWYFQVKQ